MQRQSLGSPISKLHNHGDGVVIGLKDDSTCLLSPDYDSKRSNTDDDNNERCKPSRRLSFSTSSLSSSSSSRLVHFIPLLTFLCFLVLYLVSHTPSQSDLAHFHGFKRSSSTNHIIDSISEVDRFGDIRRGDVLAISNLRNLQQIADKRVSPKSHIHRKFKIADF